MTPLDLYAVAGLVLFAAGLWGVVARAHLFWKVFGVNVAASGVFMLLLAASPRLDPAHADPVPQAMVLTGIVVAVAATAVALGMALRVTARTGMPFLEEDAPGEGATSGGSRGDPTRDDPTRGDPTRGDATRGDPTRDDPTRDDRTRGDPTRGETSPRPDTGP